MKYLFHENRISRKKWQMQGQNNGGMTKKQRAQSLADKDRHQRQSLRAFPMRGNPPVIVRPFSILGLPGTVKHVMELKYSNGRRKYGWQNGGIVGLKP